MFSQNRYHFQPMIDFLQSEYVLWPQHINGVSLSGSSTGLIYQWPYPKVDEYYDNDQFYTQHVVAEDWFEKEKQEYEAKLWHPYFDYLSSRMNPHLPVIDVGCGAGWFLNYWNRHPRRHFAYGIEPSKMAHEFYGMKPFMFYTLDDFESWRSDEFDKHGLPNSFNILMSLVLEHIPNPVSFIQQYIPYLGHHGTLTIVVPNDFSPLQQWLGTTHFIQDVHVNYFTRETLRSTIHRAMHMPPIYEIKESATFPMELFECLGLHYIENPEIGAKCHRFRLLFEKVFKKRAFQLYQKLFDKYGWGRELIFTVRKV